MTEQANSSATPPEILIVGNSAAEAELLRRSLTRWGYRTIVTGEGGEGLRAARAHRPALVLSDINMPVMDGYQLCRALKYDETLWDVPVILLTTLPEPEDIIEAINAGADGYAIKPFIDSILLERIRSLLSTPITRKRAEERRQVTVEYENKPFTIVGGSQQILTLLLSVHQSSLTQIHDLTRMQAQLNLLNENLDAQVRERTAALAESEEKFRTLFTEARDGIVLLDDTGLIVECNPEFERQTGRTLAQLRQARIWELRPADQAERAERKFREIWAAGTGGASDLAFQKPGGEIVPVEFRATAVTLGGKRYLQSVTHDITEPMRQSARAAALLELTALAATLDEKALLQRGLDTVQHLTDSRIGFFHFVSEDQSEVELVTWSSDTLAHYCRAVFEPHYPLAAAGIWADCVRLKQPVIINDYATASGKKGLPEGHAEVRRFVSVPIFDGDKVRMIIGVGNAARDYGERDVETVRLFCNDLYRIIQRKRTEETLRIQHRISHVFLTTRGEAVFNEVLTIVLEELHSPFGVFGYLDQDGSLVVPTMTRQAWELCQVPGKSVIFPRSTWGDSSWPRAIREKKPNYANAPSTNLPGGHVGISRHISFPILFQGDVIGLFQVANKDTDYTEADMRVLEYIAAHVAPILRAELQRKRDEALIAEQLDELRRWHDVTLGREMRNIELKHEINELLVQAGQPIRYPSAELPNEG